MTEIFQKIGKFLGETGVAGLFTDDGWKKLVMYAIVFVLFYLAIVKKFEPMLLLPIAFGMLLTNLPFADLYHSEFFFDEFYINKYAGADEAIRAGVFDEEGHVLLSAVLKQVFNEGGLLDILYIGVKLGIYPSLIFLGIGAMTDFSPLIANPKSLLLGAAAQFGVFAAFFFAILFTFSPVEAAAIGIIGGADGPTAILVTKELAPHLLGAIAIAAYSYMALIPMIQPPLMKLVTTKRERAITMTSLRPVSKTEKVIFPILVTLLVVLIVPDAAPLVGFLMLGNLFNVSGVTDRLSKTGQNELINIITIFLGVSVGATAKAENFLKQETLLIIILGLFAFCLSTLGGLLFGKLMCFLTKGKINPLIGSAGV
ncbi:MAG: sodium ion-translocating decarboxylase subunit beta, partial [Clostridia bacterium]|nr:sodium ion-translocating decarboxylase subunit beta [Clostridia bacterium]